MVAYVISLYNTYYLIIIIHLFVIHVLYIKETIRRKFSDYE
jgi:hypothetical protein